MRFFEITKIESKNKLILKLIDDINFGKIMDNIFGGTNTKIAKDEVTQKNTPLPKSNPVISSGINIANWKSNILEKMILLKFSSFLKINILILFVFAKKW